MKRYWRINKAKIHSPVHTNLSVNCRTCLKKKPVFRGSETISEQTADKKKHQRDSVLRGGPRRPGSVPGFDIYHKNGVLPFPRFPRGPRLGVYLLLFFFDPPAAPRARGGALAPPAGRAATAASDTRSSSRLCRFMQPLLPRTVRTNDWKPDLNSPKGAKPTEAKPTVQGPPHPPPPAVAGIW